MQVVRFTQGNWIKASTLLMFIGYTFLFLTPNALSQTEWTKYEGNPVLEHGAAGEWDSLDVLEPSVIFAEGKYRMWYTGDVGGYNQRIGYAMSDDGINWEKSAGNPVLEPSASEWDRGFIYSPSVLFKDGEYKMWYVGVPYNGAPRHIGYATSNDGVSWDKYEGNPVLSPAGGWEGSQVGYHCVIFHNGKYRMWYTGYNGSDIQIGYATSDDGINWTKYEGNPILEQIGSPSVLFEAGKYKMWYSGKGETHHRIGYATPKPAITTEAYQLTSDAADDIHPMWSPDGTKLAFSSNRGGSYGLWAINADGTGLAQLVDDPDLDEFNPDWVGSTIVYSAGPPSQNWNIYAVSSDGSGVRQVSDINNVNAPKLSPDGSKITFDSSGRTIYTGWHQPWVVNIDGAGLLQLRSSGHGMWVVWAGDSEHIAYALGSNHDQPHNIYVINADGSGEQVLISNLPCNTQLAYSRDGTKIAYLSGTSSDRNISLMNSDGTGAVEIFSNSSDEYFSSSLYHIVDDIWSPDNTRIVFSLMVDGNSDIWMIGIDGAEPTQLTTDQAKDYDAVWSPDGLKIAFVSERSGNKDIWILKKIAPFPVGDVSGDGRVTAYDAVLILQYVVGIIDRFPVEEMISPSAIVPHNYVVKVPEQTAKAGDRIYVPIVINDATGLLAGGISLKYDSTILKAVDVAPKMLLLNGAYSKANVSQIGEVRFAFATIQPMKGQGNLLLVEFEVLSNTEGKTSPLILDSVSLSNSLNVTKINGSVTVLPSKSALLQNYPNPFNPETWLPYQLASDAPVTISIYNTKGQLIRNISLSTKKAGVYTAKDKAAYWNGKDSFGQSVASGVYFYTLQAGNFTATRRMLIVK